jgi:BMFP domain-containing protein YqiC
MTTKPATDKEILTALNARVNKLEKKMTALKAPTPAVPVLDLEARITAMEARMNNAVNEMEARAERAIAAVALLARKDA